MDKKISLFRIILGVSIGVVLMLILGIKISHTKYNPITLRELSEKEQIQLYTFEKCGSLKLYKQASFIIQHESQWNTQVAGDSGDSRGLWQISRKFNPQVSDECAYSWKCATDWSIAQLKAGKANLWSTWRMRKFWFR